MKQSDQEKFLLVDCRLGYAAQTFYSILTTDDNFVVQMKGKEGD